MLKRCALPHTVKYFFTPLLAYCFAPLFLFFLIEMYAMNYDLLQEVEFVANSPMEE